MLNIVPEEERLHGTLSNKTYLKYVQKVKYNLYSVGPGVHNS